MDRVWRQNWRLMRIGGIPNHFRQESDLNLERLSRFGPGLECLPAMSMNDFGFAVLFSARKLQ